MTEAASGPIEALEKEYRLLAEQGLNLDLTRGKPSAEQVALSDVLDGILDGDFATESGVDVRNYGGLEGIEEARRLFSSVLGSAPEHTIVGGNSSLTLMYQVLDAAMNFGLAGPAWKDTDKVAFLCPVPGYDRHFSVCEHLGIELLPVAMTGHGPDMDAVETALQENSAIRGLWCVPRFSNPTGETYDADTVQRIARLGTLVGRDILVMWDNAYAVHSFTENATQLPDINPLLEEFGTSDSVVQFGSTSKMTYAGAGVAFLASGADVLAGLKRHQAVSSIGPDKVNQLRHVRLLQNLQAVEAHMQKHADLLRPRFECVEKQLQAGLADAGLGRWTRPEGGYFVSFESPPGLASEIVRLAGKIGVKLTPAGATWPYGKDPQDSNIRLAPSFASLEDVESAMAAFVICVKLAAARAATG